MNVVTKRNLYFMPCDCNTKLVRCRTHRQVRPFEIADRVVIQISDAAAGLVNELRDMGEFLKLDFLDRIGNATVVRVKESREEDDRTRNPGRS